jgi:UDP-N-acetylglucosamine--N-acetylmuramyl-(pentapeptide) pyrophosphoryl-undecaprenol N-acetylglucosamine transferase
VSKKIIIAGGGTGGHIFPAVAIANALKKIDPSVEILFIGAKGKMEMEKVPQAGYRIIGLDIAGFNRSSLIKNIALPYKLLKSFLQVRRIINEFKPDAAIGVGGYSSFPVLRYAQAKGINTFIHEANSYGGKSNVLLSKKATKVFVGGDGMEKFFPAAKVMVTGNPVRDVIVNAKVSKQEAVDFFGLEIAKPIVLVTGGSLGARGINEAIAAKLNLFPENGLQLIWQTGKAFIDTARPHVKDKPGIWTNDFITKMEFAYAAADIVVSRAGAMAIAELCVVKKPVVFVPFPFAAEDHQTANAMKLVNKNAGVLVTDKEAPQKLVDTVIALAKDGGRQEELKSNISKLAVTNADEVIAKEILRASKVLLYDGE